MGGIRGDHGARMPVRILPDLRAVIDMILEMGKVETPKPKPKEGEDGIGRRSSLDSPPRYPR